MKLFKAVNSYSKLQIDSEVEIVRKGILIVDDSKFSRNILKDILKTEGYLIVGEAGDGLEAVNMAREKKPEYIFMDVEMPKMDGLGAVSKILEIDPKIKIVMCTALGQKNIILEAAKAGAKDYILKPYSKDNIISVLNDITDKNQKEGQVIPFKAGKNHHEDLAYKPLTEEEPLQPLINDDDNSANESLDSSFDQGSLQDSNQEEILESYLNEELQEKVHTEGEAKPQEGIAIGESLEVVETAAEGEAEENLVIGELLEVVETAAEGEAEENLAIGELLEVVETAAEGEAEENLAIGEIIKEVATEAEDRAEENKAEENKAVELILEEVETKERSKFVIAVLNEDNPKGDEIKGKAEPEEAIADEDTSEIDTAAVKAEPGEAIVDENASEADTTAMEAEPEEAITNYELQENIISLEKTNKDIKSDSNAYTYLWNNRFDILQKEVIPQNSISQRVLFYEYAYLETGRYDTFIKDNLQREIALGMMKAYMSLDNRLQQDDSTNFELRTLTYAKENRFFTSNVLEKNNDKFTEITIVNEIKCSSLRPKQTPQEITIKTGFYQLVSDFVNGKSGRVLK